NPLKTISSDIFGPFKLDDYKHNFKSNKIYIITITDRCSRFSKLYLTEKINSDSVIKAFKLKWLSRFKMPTSILTDQGKGYNNNKFNEFCLRNKIKRLGLDSPMANRGFFRQKKIGLDSTK